EKSDRPSHSDKEEEVHRKLGDWQIDLQGGLDCTRATGSALGLYKESGAARLASRPLRFRPSPSSALLTTMRRSHCHTGWLPSTASSRGLICPVWFMPVPASNALIASAVFLPATPSAVPTS